MLTLHHPDNSRAQLIRILLAFQRSIGNGEPYDH